MNRRELLKSALCASVASIAFPQFGRAQTGVPNTVTFVPQSDLTLFDPVQTTGLVTRNHGMMVFDQLYALDVDFAIKPQMADEPEISEDGLTWTMTLRDGLKFHDGAPVTAEDAVVSIKRWWSSGDAYGRDLREATESLEAVSDTVFEFKLKTPFPLLTEALSKPSNFCAIMPARLANVPASQPIAEIIGSGPYRFVAEERVTGSQTVYEKFADYVPRDGGEPSFTSGPKEALVERVIWRAMPDAATAAAALQVGEIDWWEQPTPDLIPLLQSVPEITVEVKDRTGYLPMLRLNHLTAPFDNPAVRRAVIPAIDQTAYMTAVMGRDDSFWSKDVGFFHPDSRFASTDGLEDLFGPADYDKAKRLLEESGYNGEPIVMVVPTDLHALNSQSLVAADMFQKMGMVVDYQASDWGTVLQRIASKNSIADGGWSVFANYIPGLYGFIPAMHTYIRGVGTDGTFGWPTSAEVEALRDKYMATADANEQVELVRQIQAQCLIDVPYLPTGHYAQPTAYRNLSDIREGFPMFYNLQKS